MTYEFFSIIRKAVGGLAAESKYYSYIRPPANQEQNWNESGNE